MAHRITEGYFVEASDQRGVWTFVVYQFGDILIIEDQDSVGPNAKLLFSINDKKELIAGCVAINTITYYGGGIKEWDPNMYLYCESLSALRLELACKAREFSYDEKERRTTEAVERILKVLVTN